jgi:hypothetical protein
MSEILVPSESEVSAVLERALAKEGYTELGRDEWEQMAYTDGVNRLYLDFIKRYLKDSRVEDIPRLLASGRPPELSYLNLSFFINMRAVLLRVLEGG